MIVYGYSSTVFACVVWFEDIFFDVVESRFLVLVLLLLAQELRPWRRDLKSSQTYLIGYSGIGEDRVHWMSVDLLLFEVALVLCVFT
jgi:hypothetical protein